VEKDNRILGIVQDGRLLSLWPEAGKHLRLTAVRTMEARPPESGELDLKGYEGAAIMVSYQGGGGEWLNSAKVIDKANPILIEVVKNVFASASKGSWGWKLATDPDDALNFINGAGAYEHPVGEFRICATWNGSYIAFYIFYRTGPDAGKKGDWGWKKAMTIDDAWNFINGTGAYEKPVKDFAICAVNKTNYEEFFVFYR
jgi:hypothetical protein